MKCRRCGGFIVQGEDWITVYRATDVPYMQAHTPHPLAAHLTCPTPEENT